MPTAPRYRPRDTAPTGAAQVVRRARRTTSEPGGLERLVVPPEITGPRVRLGVLWFLVALAAVTAGRWWTAALAAAVSAAAGYQIARAWAIERARAELPGDAELPIGVGRIPALCAGLLATLVPLAAGYGTGAAGASLLVVATISGAVQLSLAPAVGATTSIAALLPAVAASSIVLALQIDLWAALFLVLAVSLFDAGNYLLGAEAAGRWEGPVGGLLGALAVTFTIATIGVPPLDTGQWWVLGGLVAIACPLGQWVTSALMPSPSARVPAQRRLDAYVVAGPVLVVAMWVFGA